MNEVEKWGITLQGKIGNNQLHYFTLSRIYDRLTDEKEKEILLQIMDEKIDVWNKFIVENPHPIYSNK